MRKIKFRGRDRDGKWYFGNLKLREDDPTWAAVAAWVVDPETVGEFTGLQDINGVDIYEGDIIQDKNFDGAMGFVEYQEDGFFIGDPLSWILENSPCQVIGNIHDNPDLLEGVD